MEGDCPDVNYVQLFQAKYTFLLNNDPVDSHDSLEERMLQ